MNVVKRVSRINRESFIITQNEFLSSLREKLMKTQIVLLHGLGSHPITLKPLEIYLNLLGFPNTHNIKYPVDTFNTVVGMVEYVNAEMERCLDRDVEVILIGQSMGGVVANSLHKKNWKIAFAIYIGSPLHGASLLNQIPKWFFNIISKPPYEILRKKLRENPPPHPYHTISMGWGCSEFDGCVYKAETMLDEVNHTHLSCSDHRTIFANPRLWYRVGKLLSDYESKN
jgi:pimeloyl-ACP methyl ester carboxylesterase